MNSAAALERSGEGAAVGSSREEGEGNFRKYALYATGVAAIQSAEGKRLMYRLPAQRV